MWNPRIYPDLNPRYNHVPFTWRQEVLGKVTMIIISMITTIIIIVIIIIIGQMTTKAANMINALEAVW